MKMPSVLGRFEADEVDCQSADERATTKLVRELKVPFEGGASGAVNVALFKSVDDEDRGGFVLRITIDDMGSAFIPHAVRIPKGVEVHMAGDIESKTVRSALIDILSHPI